MDDFVLAFSFSLLDVDICIWRYGPGEIRIRIMANFRRPFLNFVAFEAFMISGADSPSLCCERVIISSTLERYIRVRLCFSINESPDSALTEGFHCDIQPELKSPSRA